MGEPTVHLKPDPANKASSSQACSGANMQTLGSGGRVVIRAFSTLPAESRALLACIALAAAGLLPTAEAVAQDPAEYLGQHFPYSLFDRLPTSIIESDGGKIDVAFATGHLGQQQNTIFDWIGRSAKAIAIYFGRFPVPRLRSLIVPVPGDAIHGTTWGYRGAATRITLGEDVPDADVGQSWVMAHELVHVAFPSLNREHLWLEEGLSTYVGPIARAQAALVSAEYVWRWFAWGMPNGLPQPGDQGLDHTHTLGRTFWGGALFCLLADLGIRSRTENHQGLQTALRAITAEGGNGEVHWPLARVLELTDRATGVPEMSELYEKMRDQPVEVDLARLWSQLGVSPQTGKISFDDPPPPPPTRRAITAPPTVHPAAR